jgi:hypothetical protein
MRKVLAADGTGWNFRGEPAGNSIQADQSSEIHIPRHPLGLNRKIVKIPRIIPGYPEDLPGMNPGVSWGFSAPWGTTSRPDFWATCRNQKQTAPKLRV